MSSPGGEAALQRACVIGAGSSGIAAVKALHERGIPFDCFEKSDRVGGNWVFGNRNGMSAAYRDLFINTSRPRMEYSDFPMPESYPDFPHHTHIARYFDDYVDHFGLRELISFETGVERALRAEDGTWTVELDSGERRSYGALLVANGHHWDPRWPEPPFPGSQDVLRAPAARALLHGQLDLRGQARRRSSGWATARWTSPLRRPMSPSARSCRRAGACGSSRSTSSANPIDQMRTDPRIPFKVRQRMIQQLVKSYSGPPERYGLPKPDHRFGEAHPTVSGRILDRIQHGTITPKPNIEALEATCVRFEDGSVEEVDVIVYCTGYKISFPFFEEDFISAPDNHIELYRRVYHPGIPNVFFIGLLQPLGAIMPLAEAQGEWVGDYLLGDYALPERAEMLADIAADQAAMRARYVASKRHTIQVDYEDYLYDLASERRAGELRARERSYAPPVLCRPSAAITAS